MSAENVILGAEVFVLIEGLCLASRAGAESQLGQKVCLCLEFGAKGSHWRQLGGRPCPLSFLLKKIRTF